MTDRAESVKKAMEKYMAKQEPKTSRSKKNASPERDLQRAVLAWLRLHQFHCHHVESKAIYNSCAGRYISGQTVTGFSDIAGNSQNGTSVWIELKAPGKRSSVRDAQHDFLSAKIQTNCFAVVVDSVERLASYWFEYTSLPTRSDREKYLISILPRKKTRKDNLDDIL